MKTIIIGKARKDGKHKVEYRYAGEPNMFGGSYPCKSYNKLHTAERIGEHTLYSDDTVINNSGLPTTNFWGLA